MTGAERRHQLIDIARSLFAERGTRGTSIEEIAQRANVSKPVVYEHFGGKEGLYAVVVDREMSALLDGITSSLTKMTNNRSRLRIERVALALLTYVDERTDGFRILIRDSPGGITSGTYSTLLNEAVNQVSSILAGDFSAAASTPTWRRCTPGPGRLGVDDGAVVARCARAQEGSGGRAPGQPVLERADAPRGRPAAARRVVVSRGRVRPYCATRFSGTDMALPRMEAS